MLLFFIAHRLDGFKGLNDDMLDRMLGGWLGLVLARLECKCKVMLNKLYSNYDEG